MYTFITRTASLLAIALGMVLPASAATVVLNEFQASNGETIADEDGDFEDWIELYNFGSEAVLLAGYGLSDDDELPFRWVLPDIALEPGQFLLIFASGKDRLAGPFLHTNFSISSDGEELLLTAPDGTLLDRVDPTPVPRDLSLGRQPDGAGDWFYFDEPTPGTANTGTGYLGILDPPVFSHEGGFHASPFALSAAHADGTAVLRYTVDGSEPGPESPAFNAPLPIVDRTAEPNNLSLIPTSVPFFWTAPDGPVFKGTPVRVRAFRDGWLPSAAVTRTYFVSAQGAGRYPMPVISIVSNANNFFDDAHGIYVLGENYDGDNIFSSNFSKRGREWERPGHFELYEPSGALGLAQDVGYRTHGGTSRAFAQKPLRVYARTEYSGDSSFEYPVVPGLWKPDGEPMGEFRRFIMRNAGNDFAFAMLRDPFHQRLVERLERVETQGYRPAAVFLNGEFWGIHNLRARFDRHHLALKYGLDADRIAMLQNNAILDAGTEADRQAYLNLRQFAVENDLSDPAKYEAVTAQLDPDSLIDYFITNIYIHNTDWPHNNIRFWRYQPGDGGAAEDAWWQDGRWRWMLFDTDFGFRRLGPTRMPQNQAFLDDFEATHGTLSAVNANTLKWTTVPTNGVVLEAWPNDLWRALLENPQFERTVINRFADLLNAHLSEGVVRGTLAEVASGIAPIILEQAARWGGNENWTQLISRMDEFAMERGGFVREHIMGEFDLPGVAQLSVNTDHELGTVRVNSLVIDDALPGVNETSPYPWSGVYFQGVPLEIEAVAAPGYRFAGWGGLAEVQGSGPLVTVTPSADIALTALFEKDTAVAASLALHPTGQANWPLPTITATARNMAGERDRDYEGVFTLSLVDGPGGIEGTLALPAVEGRARFEDIVLDAPGVYRFRIEADGLEPAESGPIAVAAVETLVLPQYIQGASPDNLNRVPFVYRARIANLMPNATYRYANRVVRLDEPALQNGAGNALLPDADTGAFRRNLATPDFADPATYAEFTTDAEGRFEGWLITEPSGNARFGEPALRMRILLNDGAEGEAYHFFLTLPEPVAVVDFGEGPDDASAVWGQGPFAPRNPLFLYGTQTGGGRPIAGTIVEGTGAAVDDRYAAFYELLVAGQDAHWGTLVPNGLPGGIRRIEEYSLATGTPVGLHLSPDGRWPGGLDTTNPSTGASPLALSLPSGPGDLEVALTGIVTDADTGEPLSCAVVELTAGDASFRVTAVTDLNGAYFVETLPTDAYAVRILAPGHEALDADPVALDEEGDAIERDFALEPRMQAETIAGRVTHAVSGEPLVGVLVEAAIDGAFVADAFTCADGRYALALPNGGAVSVQLTYFLDNFVPAGRIQEIVSAESVVADEALTPLFAGTARIAGQVTQGGAGGKEGLSDARITLRGPINISTGTQADGAYALDDLLGGSYSITASAQAHNSQRRQRTLVPGEDAAEDFALLPEGSDGGIPGDVNGDGVVNAVDVQLVINAALGVPVNPAYAPDINGDGQVNAVDVQLVINAALGIPIAP